MLVISHPNWKPGGSSPEHLGRTTVDINYVSSKWSRLVFISFSSFFFLFLSSPAHLLLTLVKFTLLGEDTAAAAATTAAADDNGDYTKQRRESGFTATAESLVLCSWWGRQMHRHAAACFGRSWDPKTFNEISRVQCSAVGSRLLQFTWSCYSESEISPVASPPYKMSPLSLLFRNPSRINVIFSSVSDIQITWIITESHYPYSLWKFCFFSHKESRVILELGASAGVFVFWNSTCRDTREQTEDKRQ